MNPLQTLLADLAAGGITLVVTRHEILYQTAGDIDEGLLARIQEQVESIRNLLAPRPETVEDHVAALTRGRDMYSFIEIVNSWIACPN